MSTLTASSVPAAARYVDSWLAYRQRVLRVPGVQAAIWYDDAVVLSVAHGLADLRNHVPLTTDHLFRVASHSKTFTATAVLQLVEAGPLRLDDRVSSWVPYLAGSALADVTVREMLGHTGGVIRDGMDSDHWQLARPFPDADGLRRVALDDAAVLPANKRFKYSNIAYSLLGAVIEAVSGVPYNDYVSREIVDRLGLTRTGPELDQARAGEYAAGHSSLAYADERFEIEHVDTAAMSAATGFFSTADEMVRYAAAHFAGDTRLLGDAGKRLMQRLESEVGGGDKGHYGLGFDVGEVKGHRLFGHGGGYPGHLTRTVFDPGERFAVSVFTNAIDGPAKELADGVVAVLDLAAGQEAAGRADAARPAEPAELEPFTGRFANLWGVFDVVVLGGRLLALSPTAADPTELVTHLRREDAATLRITETGGYGALGETYRYDFAPDGAVRSLQGGGGMTFYPVEQFGAAMAGRTVLTVGGGGALL